MKTFTYSDLPAAVQATVEELSNMECDVRKISQDGFEVDSFDVRFHDAGETINVRLIPLEISDRYIADSSPLSTLKTEFDPNALAKVLLAGVGTIKEDPQ